MDAVRKGLNDVLAAKLCEKPSSRQKEANDHARRILEASDSDVFGFFASELQRSMAECFTKGRRQALENVLTVFFSLTQRFRETRGRLYIALGIPYQDPPSVTVGQSKSISGPASGKYA